MILNEGEILSKITNYQYEHGGEAIKIQVHQAILGTDEKYIAVPRQTLGVTQNPDLRAEGKTAMEALETLIKKLRGMTMEEIFPKWK